MRYNSTPEFAAARERATDAYKAWEKVADLGEMGGEEERLGKEETEAFRAFLTTPASTPKDVLTKFEEFWSREVCCWRPELQDDIVQSFKDDLQRLQASATSPAITEALLAWREGHIEFSYFNGSVEESALPCGKSATLQRALFSTPCTTAGDFIAKTYVHLLGDEGSLLRSDEAGDFIGNPFDIGIHADTDYLEDCWTRSAYEDLDQSDVGANLLAYGLPYFSASEWLQRTRAIGLPVFLIINEHGARGLHFGTDADDKVGSAAEVYRLQRILAFDHHRRWKELADEICSNAPQHILDLRKVESVDQPVAKAA